MPRTHAATIALVFLSFAVAGETPNNRVSPPLRPEWSRCKYVHPLDGAEYDGATRLVARYATRFTNQFQICQGHALDHGGLLQVAEWDYNFDLLVTLYGKPADPPVILGTDEQLHFERKLNEKGLTRRHEVRIGRVHLFDLDGDGIIDAWVDSRGPTRTVNLLRDGQITEIADSRSPFLDLPPPVPASNPPPRVIWKPRVLGPEWIRVKTIHPYDGSEQTSHRRPGAIVSYRKNNDDTTRHTLMLDQGGGIDAYERDDKSAITVELIGKKLGEKLFCFSRQQTEKGKATRHEFRFGPVTYFDLDGDGMIDCWIDRRNNKCETSILFERQVVKIDDSKGTLFEKPKGAYNVRSEGHKVEYEFLVPVGRWIQAKR